ncbi:MAG TPA: transglycosylase domain-containing protein [Candidatus Limnocylindrales bacterium]|nr:transglycosylase domain-containing protein [Candidatus Limnocylindrales bacterium]
MSYQTPDHLPNFSRFVRRQARRSGGKIRRFLVIFKPLAFIMSRLVTRRRITVASALLALFIIATPVVTYGYYAKTISNRELIMNHKQTGVVLKDKDGEVFYRQGNITVDDLDLSQISDHVEKAAIASEDRKFYTHDGYSIRGIAAAVYANLLNKDATRYGGSTITQQLVKNKLLTADKSFVRKYQEVSMAVAVENKYSKDDILEMYLNSVYFGEGAFGIKDAAKTYFNTTPDKLDLAQSSLLIGLLPAPNQYSPISGDPAKAAVQQQRVLGNMVENGVTTEAAREVAIAQTLQYAPPTTSAENFRHGQHYALMVLDQLREKYGEEHVNRSGFEVTTTLDLDRQKTIEEIVSRRIATFEAQGGRNASVVAINPKTGAVEALVGSVDWGNQEFGKVNMALAARQPGSSFKPIYYAESLGKGHVTASTMLNDKRTTFGDWTPENYDFKFRGDISVRNALALSLNIPAAEVLQKVGVEEGAQAAQRMGISTVTEPERYGLTMALGTAEVKLYEMTNAYAAFANQGLQYKPMTYTSITDKTGKIVYAAEPQEPTEAQSAEASYVLSSILADNKARAPTFGSSLTIPGRQVAVKTGTTNDSKDAWTIGYTPSLTIGVWVGNNENQPMRGLAGGSSAGLIWKDSMSTLLSRTERETFPRPQGIVQMPVCRSNGQRADRSGGDSYREVFIDRFLPTDTCSPRPQNAEPQRDLDRGVERIQPEQNQQDVDPNRGPGNGNRERVPNRPPTPAPLPVPQPEPAQQPAPQTAQNPVTTAQPVGGRGGGSDDGDRGEGLDSSGSDNSGSGDSDDD